MEPKSEKLSATEPVKFRPGPALAAHMSALMDEVAARGGRITLSEVIRDGLLGCWPEVRAHLLVRHTTKPAHSDDVARIVAIAAKALDLGVTPEAVEEHFQALLEQSIAAGATPSGL